MTATRRRLAALALALLGCGRHGSTTTAGAPPEEAAPAPAFVGERRCAECHPDEAERWRGSHHDLAMQEAGPSTVLGDFDDATFRNGAVTTTFTRRGDRFYVRTDGADGAIDEFEIAYTFGVEPLQQYLVALPDGRIQALSIGWDTRPAADGGQRWFHLYPGEAIDAASRLHWTGIDQNWNFMCAECHSTGLSKGYDPATDRYATTWSELDVSCEACHGRGSAHVAWAERSDRSDDGSSIRLGAVGGRSWVVDPDSGNPRLDAPAESRHDEVEVCAGCHARRSPLVDEAGRDDEPDAHFSDRYRLNLLDDGIYHADGSILDEVYVYGSFLQSRMHRFGVSCSDCHDPHSARLLTAEPDAVCARCHDPGRFAAAEHHHHAVGSPGASCVECHMPSRTYMVVDPRRDHGFRVPRPDLTLELGTPSACSDCHRDRSPEWLAARFDERHADRLGDRPEIARALAAGRRIDADAAERLVALVADRDAPAIARATAADLLSAHLGADTLPALETALGDADPLVRAAAVRSLAALPPEARFARLAPRLDDSVRLVRIDAARALAAYSPAEMSGDRARAWRAAIDEARSADLAAAERPEAQTQLAALESRLGDHAAAERHLRRALAIDPGYVAAAVNLTDLYRATGRDELGEAVLREALDRRPSEASLRHALGLLLVRRQRLAEALVELEAAATSSGAEPRYGYVFGVALHSAGETERALAELEAAHRRSPGDRELLWALATIHRDAGHLQAARDAAERLQRVAPGDPRPPRLLAELDDAPRLAVEGPGVGD